MKSCASLNFNVSDEELRIIGILLKIKKTFLVILLVVHQFYLLTAFAQLTC